MAADAFCSEGFRLENGMLRREGLCTQTNLRIPEGAVCVENGCFSGCTSLETVELPASLRELGVSAFAGCTGLRRVILPAGVTRIRKSCFDGCIRLEEFTIPDTVVGIGEWAFRGCASLKRVLVPWGVTDICAEVFIDCPALVIEAPPGSCAAAHAEKFGIRLRLL